MPNNVMVAVCAPQKVDSLFASSLMGLTMWDGRFGSQHLADPPALWMIGGSLIVLERNQAVNHFLASDAEWIWFIDTDQTFPPDLLERMMSVADAVDRPIVGAPVWVFRKEAGELKIGVNVFDVVEGGGFVPLAETSTEQDRIEQVAAVGTGCLLVHRSALERMQAHSVEMGGSRESGWFWLLWAPPDHTEGEDLWFCRLAARCGIPVFVDWLNVLGHLKPMLLHGGMDASTIHIAPPAAMKPVKRGAA